MKKLLAKTLFASLFFGTLFFSTTTFAEPKNYLNPKEPEILTEAEKSSINVDFVDINETIKKISIG